MVYEKMTRQQKRALEVEYVKMFGEQVKPMKTLFKTKEDPILFEELLNNVCDSIFLLMKSNHLDKVEAILERMQLSVLEYDTILFNNDRFDEYEIHIIFYNDFQIVTFSDMTINNALDLKKVILMIMHVGVQYDSIYQVNHDVAKHLDEYRLLDGFDQNLTVTIKTESQEKISVN